MNHESERFSPRAFGQFGLGPPFDAPFLLLSLRRLQDAVTGPLMFSRHNKTNNDDTSK